MQPGDYGFGEEAALLKQSAQRFFSEHLPVDQLHALVAAEHDPERAGSPRWIEAHWQQMVELGWTSLAVPEHAGGLGLPLVAVAGLAEELGRAAWPGPLFATLASTLILARCGESAHAALADISAGRSMAPVLDLGPCAVQYRDDRLSGSAQRVLDAAKCDQLLVLADGAEGLQWFHVAAQSAGITQRPDAIIDLTRDQCSIDFADVPAQRLSVDGAAALEAAWPALWTLAAADMVGAAEWQLQTTVDYARSRKQFDRPLGFFQAVKHQLVDVMLRIDESRSLVYAAACAVDCEPERAQGAAHMAKASASETADFASARTVQCHGGIGFTWECFLHLYFKRQQHSVRLWGDARWHHARLAQLLMGEPGARARAGTARPVAA
jgi:alkylation response protein AidB-like acyl-CoA dehydrogenase